MLDTLVSVGVLAEGRRSDVIFLEECLSQETVEPIFWVNPATGKLEGFARCEDPDCELHFVDPERMRTWWLTWDALARTVAQAAKATGPVVTDVADRISMLGTVTKGEVTRELYLVRGWAWRDRESAFASAQRLSRSTNATMIFLDVAPPLDVRQAVWKAVLLLSDIGSIRKGKLTLPLHRLFEDQTVRPADDNQGIALTEQDLDVLEALNENPSAAMVLVDLMAAAGYSKWTVRECLDRLIAQRLVQRPSGSARKGVMITAEGQKFLSDRSLSARSMALPKAAV